jgi:hypothetical protein
VRPQLGRAPGDEEGNAGGGVEYHEPGPRRVELPGDQGHGADERAREERRRAPGRRIDVEPVPVGRIAREGLLWRDSLPLPRTARDGLRGRRPKPGRPYRERHAEGAGHRLARDLGAHRPGKRGAGERSARLGRKGQEAAGGSALPRARGRERTRLVVDEQAEPEAQSCKRTSEQRLGDAVRFRGHARLGHRRGLRVRHERERVRIDADCPGRRLASRDVRSDELERVARRSVAQRRHGAVVDRAGVREDRPGLIRRRR